MGSRVFISVYACVASLCVCECVSSYACVCVCVCVLIIRPVSRNGMDEGFTSLVLISSWSKSCPTACASEGSDFDHLLNPYTELGPPPKVRQ